MRSLLMSLVFCVGLISALTAQPAKTSNDLGSKADPYIVDLTAADYAFAMPSEIKSGWVTFKMKNIGKEEHFAAIDRINDDIPFDSLNSWVIEGFNKRESSSLQKFWNLNRTKVSGPGFLSSGHTGETTVYLRPGQYVMICGIRTENNEFHFTKGMVKAFAVTDTESGAPNPKFTAQIKLSSLAISTDRAIGSGNHTFKVQTMNSQDVHLVRLNDGQEFEELTKWMGDFRAPSPFSFLGGVEEGTPDQPAYFTAELSPGRYAFISHGSPGAMGEHFTIPESGKAPAITNQPVNPPVQINDSTQKLEVPTGRTLITVTNTKEKTARVEGFQLRPGFSVRDFVVWWEKVRIYQTAGFLDNPFPYTTTERKTLAVGESMTFNLDVQAEDYLFIWREDFNNPKLTTEERMEKVTIMTGKN